MTPPRRLAVAAATLTLAAFTTACGAIGQAVDCNTAASDATKIATEFSSSMTDASAVESAAKTASDKTKELAGKYDGEVAAALNDLADAYNAIKPGDAASMTEFSTKINGFTSKITAACS
ncbi:hypothetical protein ACU635_13660 [[Actinomadura] parvosata]|uniref:hypothetical protein n=1 Tax=[Actinomadura] parvosata TaxID=1955412 RepID=UPI00406C9A98